jgi:hypothetical protein
MGRKGDSHRTELTLSYSVPAEFRDIASTPSLNLDLAAAAVTMRLPAATGHLIRWRDVMINPLSVATVSGSPTLVAHSTLRQSQGRTFPCRHLSNLNDPTAPRPPTAEDARILAEEYLSLLGCRGTCTNAGPFECGAGPIANDDDRPHVDRPRPTRPTPQH